MRTTRAQEVLLTISRWSPSVLPKATPGWLGHDMLRAPVPALLQALQLTTFRNHQTATMGSEGSTSTRPAHGQRSSIDPREAAKFAQLASEWWHPKGPFSPLHRLNPARCKFIRGAVCAMHGLDDKSHEPFKGLHVLDVGCGGGILSESMARMGANTHGIDITHENVQAAATHAALDPLVARRVRYECTPLESLLGVPGTEAPPDASPSSPTPDSGTPTPTYDVVLASEVLEHVRRPDLFVRRLAAAVAPGGTLVVSTLSRTPPSWAMAILGAEYVTGMVPRGTHDWHKFITPQELYLMARDADLSLAHAAGMTLSPATGRFMLTEDLSVNYIAAFHKAMGSHTQLPSE